jgi:hypothetical protein
MTTRAPSITVLATLAIAIAACSGSAEKTIPWCHESVGPGAVLVGARFAGCPEITSYEVTPVRLAPGETAQLTATVRDIDSTNLSYSWTAESGVVTDPTSVTTTYRCKGGEGIVKLTLVASDGSCQDVIEAAVDCAP